MPFVQTRVSSQFYSPFRVHPGRCNKRQSVFDTFFSLEGWIRYIYIYIYLFQQKNGTRLSYFLSYNTDA